MPLKGTYPRWVWVLAAVTALVALLVSVRSCSASADPSSFINSKYERKADLDQDGEKAYVASGKTPSAVADEISGSVSPIDRRTSAASSADGGGDATFLQYRDQMVAIFPYQGGSRIMIGEYSRSYNHYHSYVGVFWTPTPNYSGGGSNNRGGGTGAGK